MKKLRVVWGAPCSGKTTYCEKNLQGHDVVWDWDAMKRALIYGQDHERVDFIIDLLFKLRGAYLRAVKEDDNIDDAFIIVSFLDDKMRKFIEEDVGIEDVEYHLVEATMEECLERLKNDDTRPDKELETERIKEWFETYGDQEKSEERKEIMKRKLETRQYRSLLLNLDAKDTQKRIESDHYVEGYATTFEPYLLWEDESGPIYEEFSAECFRDTDMSDVILQFDHMGRVYARQSNGSLIVEVDDKGLFIAADLSRSTGARELYQEIKEGLITKMSWGFRLGEYSFDKETNTIKHESIKKVFDVSAVSIPANGGTEINARTLVDGVIRQRLVEDQERKKLALKLKLALEGE